MGGGIAEVCARAGLNVVLDEINADALALARGRIAGSLERAVRAGKLSEADRHSALGRLAFTTDLGDFADRDLVIEAVAEREQTKVDVFTTLDKVVTRTDAIFASNTSSIPIMKLAMATSRPEQVIGIHFFNPVPVLKLVELIPSLLSSVDTQQRAEAFAGGLLGKTVVRCQDRAGFVVNALLVPYLLSAIRMMESGFASADDIDNGMVLGCAHPMGPLALADLIGLDTVKAVAESMYAEFKEPLYSPPPLLLRMADAGLWGKKSGRGFYDYTT
jgi:3-hydroxybutyryl-CoA dehydrogenase